MQLDKLQAVLRQRSSFEAIDLGFAMVRRWRGPVFASWFAVVLPSYALIWALLHNHPIWAYLLLWFLIPLWDRVPLFVMSRALFGDTPTLGVTLRAMPRILIRHLFYTLLLYRLDPARSFFLPVLQLEGGVWGHRTRRRAALLRNMGGPTAWLTFVFLFLHLVMFMGFMMLLLIMLPDRPEWSLSYLWEQLWDGTAPKWLYLSIPVAELLSLTLIEPLYVAGGFALYLNRRTQLEGWDIELIFRRLAERLRSSGLAKSSKAAALVVAIGIAVTLLAAVLSPSTALAQPSKLDPADLYPDQPLPQDYGYPPPLQQDFSQPDFPPPPPIARQYAPVDVDVTIAKVLERPEFGKKAKRWIWRPRDPEEEEEASEPWELPSFLEFIGRFLAAGIEGVLWIVAGIVVAGLLFLIFYKLRGLGPTGEGGRKREQLPGPLSGLLDEDGAVMALPGDVPATALSLFDSGRHAEALALLYRGALSVMEERWTIIVEENATEGECLRAVRQSAPDGVASFFESITRSWQMAAYAHRVPDRVLIHQICTRWPHFFGASS